MADLKKIARVAARLSPGQWEIIGKFDLNSRRMPEHGNAGYHALIRKGVLEWSGFRLVRLSPLGLAMRWLLIRIVTDRGMA